MKDLARLVNTLKPKEILHIRNIYKNQSRGTSKENMCLTLFNCLLNNKVRNNKEAYALICPKKHVSIISQVKKRLESDILNIILVSSITDTNNLQNQCDFVCQKNLLLGRILIDRGLMNEAMQLLHSTSMEAGKAELHDIKIHCDDILRSAYIEGDFNYTTAQFRESADSSMESLSGYQHAKSLNYPFMYAKTFSDPFESTSIDVEKLTINIKKSTSRKAVYWYNLAIIHHYIQNQENEHARCCALYLFNKSLVNNDMSSAFEKSEFYLQLSRILTYLKEPNDAVQAAKKCIEYLPHGIPEVSLPFQMLIRGYMRVGNLEKAMEVADRALKHENGHPDSRNNIWYLFKAGIFFTMKKYRESNQILIAHDQHFGDNILQKTFYLLYELINIIELGDFYWFDYKFDSFRKRIQRLTIKENDRIRYLYDLLNLFKRYNFQYRGNLSGQVAIPVVTRHSLSSVWDPLGVEVIDIEEWVLNKMQFAKPV
jgi:pentatricopeptide repeat protein